MQEKQNIFVKIFHIAPEVNDKYLLTYFQPMFYFYTHWKHQKTRGFLMFSEGIEVEHWLKIG